MNNDEKDILIFEKNENEVPINSSNSQKIAEILKEDEDVMDAFKHKEDFDEFVTYKMKHFEEYEGPYSLILLLIKKAKIDIKDIFIANITEQFMQYVQQVIKKNMDEASDYIIVGTTLVEMKAKAILPRIGEEEEEQDPEVKQFIQNIDLYKKIKDASEKLKENEEIDKFYKEADDSVFETKDVLGEVDLDSLINAFSKVLVKVELGPIEKTKHREIKKDIFTVAEKTQFIKDLVVEHKKVQFSELFDDDKTKVEVITTFQAMLELLKLQIICVAQDDTFADIAISLKEGALQIMNQPLQIDDYKGE